VYIDRVPITPAAGSAVPGGGGQVIETDPGSGYGGVGHLDCEKVSQQLSVILDVEELIPGEAGYILEVSSPGLDRELKRPQDFERFAGRLAKISTVEAIGDAKFFEGRLAGFTHGRVRMELKGSKDKEPRVVEVPIEAIRKANLVVEW
jgi:ribosome maturation factor RimP